MLTEVSGLAGQGGLEPHPSDLESDALPVELSAYFGVPGGTRTPDPRLERPVSLTNSTTGTSSDLEYKRVGAVCQP